MAGAWESEWQLPKHYTPGLRSQPWHSLGADPVAAAAAEYLKTQTAALRGEYARLKAAGRMMREQECEAQSQHSTFTAHSQHNHSTFTAQSQHRSVSHGQSVT